MKYVLIVFLLSVFLALGLSSCYYDKESQLYPFSSNCDTLNVTYSVTIKTILQNGGCFGCHTTPAASGGNIPLDTYSGVQAVAQNGKLLGSISHSPGFSPMPQNGGKLTNCDITKVRAWINKGMLNN
jgi:hypothetical protein